MGNCQCSALKDRLQFKKLDCNLKKERDLFISYKSKKKSQDPECWLERGSATRVKRVKLGQLATVRGE